MFETDDYFFFSSTLTSLVTQILVWVGSKGKDNRRYHTRILNYFSVILNPLVTCFTLMTSAVKSNAVECYIPKSFKCSPKTGAQLALKTLVISFRTLED